MKRIFRMIRLWFTLAWLEHRVRRQREVLAGGIEAETFVKDLQFRNGRLEMTAELPHQVMRWWGEVFALTLFDEERTNYWTADLWLMGQGYEIRIQRMDRPTPAQKLRRLEGLVSRMLEDSSGVSAAYDEARAYLAELPEGNPNHRAA